jgi:hypothetical protein
LRKRVSLRPLLSSQQPRQLGDVHSNAPRFIARQQFAGGASAGLVLAIDEGECLTVVVADDEARRGLFDEAAGSGAVGKAWG